MKNKEIGLFTPSVGYKPFRYQWAYDWWVEHETKHWLTSEIPLGQDVKDWNNKLCKTERYVITQIFRFFTQADIDVQKQYSVNLTQLFKPTEIRMCLSSIAARENAHIDAYSNLLDTLGMEESEYSAFLKYKEMSDKHEFYTSFGLTSNEEVLISLAVFHAFNEGLQLFSSFVILLAFPFSGKLQGMGQNITLSLADESLHCDFMIRLFHEFAHETGAFTKQVKSKIYECCEKIVELEDAFIDLVFKMGDLPKLTSKEVKDYIRFTANHRLKQLKLKPLYEIKEHPIPWLVTLTSGVEHANFFEVRNAEYVKASTTGTWEDAWGDFDDNRQSYQ